MIYLSYRDRPVGSRRDPSSHAARRRVALRAGGRARSCASSIRLLPIYDVRTLSEHVEKNLFHPPHPGADVRRPRAAAARARGDRHLRCRGVRRRPPDRLKSACASRSARPPAGWSRRLSARRLRVVSVGRALRVAGGALSSPFTSSGGRSTRRSSSASRSRCSSSPLRQCWLPARRATGVDVDCRAAGGLTVGLFHRDVDLEPARSSILQDHPPGVAYGAAGSDPPDRREAPEGLDT